MEHLYTGYTTNLKNRLEDHNKGKSPHTKKHRPWHIINYFAFDSKEKALTFEKYLKTGSGIAFAKKHLL